MIDDRMIDLYSISSLPIQFDYQDSSFTFQDCMTCRKRTKIGLQHLVPALLNRTLRYPEIVYEENEDLYSNEDQELFSNSTLQYDIIILPAGLLGIEYIKTHIYYSPHKEGKYGSFIECLHGILTILIQKNKPKDDLDFETEVDEGILIRLRRGEKIAIPSGYYYTFINSRNDPVIFSRLHRGKGIIDYSELMNEQGLGYYAIRKNARTELVFNPRYKYVPKIKKCVPTSDPFRVRFGKRALYEQIKKDVEYFIESLA